MHYYSYLFYHKRVVRNKVCIHAPASVLSTILTDVLHYLRDNIHAISCSYQHVITDLTIFMDLFDNLSKLTKSSDENIPSVLDSDYKHSVLGKQASV